MDDGSIPLPTRLDGCRTTKKSLLDCKWEKALLKWLRMCIRRPVDGSTFGSKIRGACHVEHNIWCCQNFVMVISRVLKCSTQLLQGFYKLTDAELQVSCGKNGDPACPTGKTCICRPCVKVIASFRPSSFLSGCFSNSPYNMKMAMQWPPFLIDWLQITINNY